VQERREFMVGDLLLGIRGKCRAPFIPLRFVNRKSYSTFLGSYE
jgi:hypothetical protein